MTTIPARIAEVYEALKTEVTWLHGRWIVYRQLYGESTRRIDMLNECASAFFYIIQDLLIGDVQVTLSKLTDPASRSKHANLSLEHLQLQLETYGDQSVASQMRPMLDELHDKCKPFRIWRNKQLAHLDLTTSMKSSPDPLPGISRQMIEDALSLLRIYMNKIEAHYHDSEVGYEHFIMSSDGNALLDVIRNGLRYEELRQKNLIQAEDWLHATWKDA
jgi:AbiU2